MVMVCNPVNGASYTTSRRTCSCTAGRLVVTYEQRQPGAVDWHPIHIERTARPEDAPAVPIDRAG
jgi:hypothetical protein